MRPPRISALYLDFPPHLSGLVELVLRQRRQLEIVLAGPLPLPTAALVNAARVRSSVHSQLPRRCAARLVLHPLLLPAPPTEHGLRGLCALDLRSALVSCECWLVSEGVTHARLLAQLLAGSPSLWFTCVCFSEGGGGRKASATSRWTK